MEALNMQTLAKDIVLADLLPDTLPLLNTEAAALQTQVKGLALDTRRLTKGDLFFALNGGQQDAFHYIDDAYRGGANAVLLESGAPLFEERLQLIQQRCPGMPIVPVHELRHRVSEIAARFYGQPSMNLQMFAVTGTNGKTSCNALLASALQSLGVATAVIGTLGYGRPGEEVYTGMTTPDAVQVQLCLAEFVADGYDAAAMEVSSHGIEQGRVSAVNFDVAILTNISRDHLDYHGSMENYVTAKRKLFTDFAIRVAVVNIDDRYGAQFSQELVQLDRDLDCVTYSMSHTDADIYVTSVDYTANGFTAQVNSRWGAGELSTPLLGRFNVMNCLAVVAALVSSGQMFDRVLDVMRSVSSVPGRMQTVSAPSSPVGVIVDFAHTPDALENALLAAKMHCHGRLWCVFGCGGNRDIGKRAMMGSVATRYADCVVITSDNPRHEVPQTIADNILEGVSPAAAAHVELDRQLAIEYALVNASDGDVVLIAGKGHEQYQEVADARLPFSDFEAARSVLREQFGVEAVASGGVI